MAKKAAKRLPKPAAQFRRPIAIVTSDNHLQDRAWTSRPALEGDAYHAFEYIVDYAIEQQLPIIAAGDLIDRQKNESKLVMVVAQQMAKLFDMNVRFLFIQGQHELQEVPWLNAIHTWPEWLHEQPTHINGLPENLDSGPLEFIYGIDWTPADKLQERLAAVPPNCKILVMHQVCNEWMGDLTAPELRWEMIPGHVRLVIVGDYHGWHGRLERKNAEGRDLVVLCPGSTAMQEISEPPVKQFFVLCDDLSIESVTIPGRPFLQPPELHLPDHLDEFVTAARAKCEATMLATATGSHPLPEQLRKPIVYVKYHYDLPDAYQRIAAAIGDAGFLFAKELRNPMGDAPTEEEQAHEEVIAGGLLGALPQVAPDPDSDLYRVSHRLLADRRPEIALQALRKEFLDD